jgi:small nuclear ribonucleoprotein (snRNP)-like protein
MKKLLCITLFLAFITFGLFSDDQVPSFLTNNIGKIVNVYVENSGMFRGTILSIEDNFLVLENKQDKVSNPGKAIDLLGKIYIKITKISAIHISDEKK